MKNITVDSSSYLRGFISWIFSTEQDLRENSKEVHFLLSLQSALWSGTYMSHKLT